MASSTSTPSYPADIKVRPEVQAFISDFFKLSDTPGQHDEYVDRFTKDATFILASKVSKGTDEIRATREGMWSAVASRKHTVHQVFPFGNDATEVMMYGIVDLGLKAGGNMLSEWAAHAKLDFSGDKGRLSFYQVYLDTGAKNPYKK